MRAKVPEWVAEAMNSISAIAVIGLEDSPREEAQVENEGALILEGARRRRQLCE